MAKIATESAVSGRSSGPQKTLYGGSRTELLRLMMLGRAAGLRARMLAGEDRRVAGARRHREAVGAGAAAALSPGDWLIAPGRYVAAHLGRRSGAVGSSFSGPDLIPMAVGVAIGVVGRGSRQVVLTLLDERSMATERWSEALAIATAERLPLVVVVERDRPAPSDPALMSGGGDGPLLLEVADALDPEAVMTQARRAAEHARAGRGPALVPCIASVVPGRPAARDVGSRPEIADPIELYAGRLMRARVPRGEIVTILRSAQEEATAWRP